MDKAIIFGVYDFVNFHICKALLDKGVEVKGVQLEKTEKGLYLDEKRLEVGRNSNFSEHLLSDWDKQNHQNETKSNIIFSFYDLFMLYKEYFLEKEAVTKPILQYLVRNKENCESIALILPIQMLTNSMDSHSLTILKGFLKETKEVSERIQLLYLPTIYGPWQPTTFLFQHSILSKMHRIEEFKGIREETSDALFIEDATDSMLEIIDKGKSGSYLLDSGRKNQWNRCAAFLNLDEDLIKKNSREQKSVGEHILRVPIKNVTSISAALSKQTEHSQRLYTNGF